MTPTHAERSIESTLERCLAAEAARDAGRIAACFAEDGVLEEAGRVLRGRAAIRKEYLRLQQRPKVAGSPAWPHLRCRVVGRAITISGPGRATVVTRLEVRASSGWRGTGTCVDILCFVDGVWLIMQRRRVVASPAVSAPRPMGVKRRHSSQRAEGDPRRPREAGRRTSRPSTV